MHCSAVVLGVVTSWGWPEDQFRPPVLNALQQAMMQVESDRVLDDDEDSWQWRADLRRKMYELLDLPNAPDEDDEEPHTDRAPATPLPAKEKGNTLACRPARHTA
jgi:hypothetical protein